LKRENGVSVNGYDLKYGEDTEADYFAPIFR